MALLNKPGVLMYHVALFILFGTLFLTMKNLNLEDVTATTGYSEALKASIFGIIGITIAFGFVVTIASMISKARKNSGLVKILMIFLWIDLGIMALYTFFLDILKEELTDPGIRWIIVILTSILFFISVIGIILFKFPGKVEESILAEKVRKKLVAREKKEDRPYCPVCRTSVDKSFKYCPKCAAKFSD